MKRSGISIIICCFNSALRLPKTLRYIALQEVPNNIPWEVIVVNNASKDNTTKVAKDLWSQTSNVTSLRVVEQPVPGLSFAREKGIESAQYDYLLFCDDDNWLSKDYVRIAFEIMEANPHIGALGGHGVAEFEVEPPEWLERFLNCYAVGRQHEQNGELDLGCVIYGAGAIFRKTVFSQLISDGFQTLLKDREGDKLTSGGDYEWCYALTLAGYKVWYDDRLMFRHFIPKERINWPYIVKNHISSTQAEPILNAYRIALEALYKKRRGVKNTWQWLLLMRANIFFGNLFTSFFSLLTSNHKEAYLNMYRSLKQMQYMFLYRRQYSRSLINIGNSKWVKKNI